MAYTLFLPDGSIEVLFTRDDFQRLIYEKLGSEAEQKLIEIIEEADYTKAKVETDIISYEFTLERNALCFSDLLDDIKELRKLLQQHRIDRTKINKILDQMEEQILEQI